MRKNKLTHLLEPGMRLYFVFLLLFAAASALFSVPIAVIEAAVVLVLYLYLRRTNAQRQKEILKYIDSVTQHGHGHQGHHGQRPPAHGDLPAGERRGDLV